MDESLGVIRGFSYATEDAMPYKPKQPCAYPGCPKLCSGQYCAEHKKLVNKQYETYSRDKAAKAKYDGAWRKIRKMYAEVHPFCEACLKKGYLTPVEHVHHRKPLTEGGTHDFSNLMSLCKPCHRRIHNKMGNGWHD